MAAVPAVDAAPAVVEAVEPTAAPVPEVAAEESKVEEPTTEVCFFQRSHIFL